MGRSKKHSTCIICHGPSYGVMCKECRIGYRQDMQKTNYRGSHRMIVCPGCGGQMHKNAGLCVNCYKSARKGDLVSGSNRALEMITITCVTCGSEFNTVKDWPSESSKHRGLASDKPDSFYCSEEHYFGDKG